jgi:hypothetical protein
MGREGNKRINRRKRVDSTHSLNDLLTRRVKSRSGLVKQENLRVSDQRSSDCQPLLLSTYRKHKSEQVSKCGGQARRGRMRRRTTELSSLSSDLSLEPLRQRGDKLHNVGRSTGRLELLLSNLLGRLDGTLRRQRESA